MTDKDGMLNELREECYRLEERAKMFQEGMLAEQLRRLKLEDALWNLLRDSQYQSTTLTGKGSNGSGPSSRAS